MGKVLNFIDVYIAVHNGVYGKGRNGLHAELVHDILAVGDYGGQADVQVVCNLLVDKSLYDERHDFNLTVGKNLLLQHLRHRRQIASATMGVLGQGSGWLMQREWKSLSWLVSVSDRVRTIVLWR